MLVRFCATPFSGVNVGLGLQFNVYSDACQSDAGGLQALSKTEFKLCSGCLLLLSTCYCVHVAAGDPQQDPGLVLR
jgi:hypothetical protein